MFKVGQRVRVKQNVKYADGIFNNQTGIISKLNEVSRWPYKVTFDSSDLNDKSTVCGHNNLFKVSELCVCEPTDIMEYLKYMLSLEKN